MKKIDWARAYSECFAGGDFSLGLRARVEQTGLRFSGLQRTLGFGPGVMKTTGCASENGKMF